MSYGHLVKCTQTTFIGHGQVLKQEQLKMIDFIKKMSSNIMELETEVPPASISLVRLDHWFMLIKSNILHLFVEADDNTSQPGKHNNLSMQVELHRDN